LGVAEHRAAIDQAGTADDSVSGGGLGAHALGVDLGTDHLQRAGVAEDFEALNRREHGIGARC
jgi:hypothetical protein